MLTFFHLDDNEMLGFMNHPTPLPLPPSPSYKEFKICDVTMTPFKTAALFTLKLQRLESCLVKLGLKLGSL